MNTNSKLILVILCLFAGTFLHSFEKKNLLKSLFVPGWGQISEGSKSGYLFLASETLFWCSKYYFVQEADLLEQEAMDNAYRYADLNPGNYDEEFLVYLERYSASGYEFGGYNQEIYQQAVELYPDDLAKRDEYIDANSISDNRSWEWVNEDKQRQYKIIREDVRNYKDFSKLMTGVIIANHAASAISYLLSTKLDDSNISLNVNLKKETPILNCSLKF